MVLDWLDTPEGQQYYAEILDERLQNLEDDYEYDFQRSERDENILQSIYSTAENMERNGPVLLPHSADKPAWKYFKYGVGAVAACISLLIVVVVYQSYFGNTIVHTTAYGETETIQLQDGSTVTLNANSQLTYAKNWENNATRQVWLEGEAYFTVTHQANDQKFLVHTQNLDVEVLGTEFNVHNRRGETQVVLNSGKVKLDIPSAKPTEKELTMQPGELVTFSEEKKQVEKKVVNPEVYTSWVNDVLFFEDMPMYEIEKLIEDNFGVKVVITDTSINNMRFNATVPAKDLEVLLTLLEKTFSLTIEKDHNKIIMRPNNKPAP